MSPEPLNDAPTRRTMVCAALCCLVWLALPARAQDLGPDALISQLTSEVIAEIKANEAIQAGDVDKVLTLIDAKVMPHVDAGRMTATAAGRFWRQASPQQRQRLQEEFKRLVVRTYAGALSQVKDQTVRVLPSRASTAARQAVVRTEVRGQGNPIRIDYRLTLTASGWKIHDVSVLGVWLAQNYRNSFAREIRISGIDGLIAALAAKNESSGTR